MPEKKLDLLRAAARITVSLMERGATWIYLTTDQPFGRMQERFIRGMIANIKEHRKGHKSVWSFKL
jgi:hypothetical protein